MTIRDFMNYLIYVEHAAENLQFFLWYKDYEKRFRAANTSDIALAPEWTRAMEDDAVGRIRKENAEKLRRDSPATDIFKGTDFEKQGLELPPSEPLNPFSTPPMTPNKNGEDDSIYAVSSNRRASSTLPGSYHSHASEAFHAAGVRQPCKLKARTSHSCVAAWKLTINQLPSSPTVKKSIESLPHTLWTEPHGN